MAGGFLATSLVHAESTPGVLQSELLAEMVDAPIIYNSQSRERHPKITTSILRVIRAFAERHEAGLARARHSGLKLRADRADLEIAYGPGHSTAIIQAIEKVGGEVTRVGRDGASLQAWVPIGAIEALSDRPDIRSIREPARQFTFAVESEGLPIMNATDWHAAGMLGDGVRVGIIDSGFLGYNALLGTELPASVSVKNFVAGEDDSQVDGFTDHGTAVAELVHDVAPSAELFFAKTSTSFEVEDAADWLTDAMNVDVISTSIGFVTLTPGDGTGQLADMVAEAKNKGVLWVTAAGNFQRTHWGGNVSLPAALPCGSGVNPLFDPQSGQLLVLPPGLFVPGLIRWSDWEDRDQDFQLAFARWAAEAPNPFWEVLDVPGGVENIADDQKPGQEPREALAGETFGIINTFYGWIITRNAGNEQVKVDLFSPVAELNCIQPFQSLSDLADSPDATTVAAVDLTTLEQARFSSEGPTNGPGGIQEGGLPKPELAFAQPVSTASRPAGFTGTSAATPHVGGAAALLTGFYAQLNPDEVEQRLLDLAVDTGSSGFDTQTGFGRLDLGTSSPDLDADGILDDGDISAVAGDGLCTNGSTTGCDDNCVATANADQATQDNDGLGDFCDNCIELPNGPLIVDAGGNVQLDTDADGYGNMCDCDFDNDQFCNIGDFNLFLPDFQSGQDSGIGSDMDGDGFVTIGDFNLFLPGFQKGFPGPSAFGSGSAQQGTSSPAPQSATVPIELEDLNGDGIRDAVDAAILLRLIVE